ncbi:hypothetical protein KC340_g10496 [Hortaea werneckii]|nr:hypothetical protein KC342_g14770 [Hortaea werneckii]KAI7107250.1 hypothetical protein KC339_g2502 [Hortaea werneckii]KAI7231044.1 hypothetical protein KC365_g7378 [Hortaea werneckii]KAI7310444.1 hypothetical protein KC340_g10496 [Hortaea werneckii]KAI7407455.1 hypothetical protein KC328_g513 [Hortaea werneckii]
MPSTNLVKPIRISATFSRSVRRHTFATSSAHRGSILFSLNSLSNSRETQHFNKLSKLNRVEHSPPLKLIEQSEVKPYPLPALPPDHSEELASETPAISDTQTSELRASEIGRAVLAQHAKQLRNLQRRKKRQRLAFEAEREAWRAERAKYQTQMREAGGLLLVSIAAATGLATWRFWPDNDKKVAGTDSGVLGREMDIEAERVMHVSEVPSKAVEATPGATAIAASPSGASASYAPVPSASSSEGRWWKGLFWKES